MVFLAGRTSKLGSTGLLWAVLMSLAASCRAPQPKPTIDQERVPEPTKDSGAPEVTGSLAASQAVEQAGAPFEGLRLRDGVWLSDHELLDELARGDVVCLGGTPDLAADHWAALQLASSLARRADHSGRSLGLGLQAFSTGAQKTLDLYQSGQADERTLLREAAWRPAPYPDFGLYRPLLKLARELALPVLGLDADRKLVALVAEKGLASLDRKEWRRLSNLDLAELAHRQRFESHDSADAGAGSRKNRHVTAVLGEETMAETAAQFVASRQPASQLLVLARTELCRTAAVPARIVRRAASSSVVSIRRVDRADSASPGVELEGFDYALVPQSDDPASSAAAPAGALALDSSAGTAAPRQPERRAPTRRTPQFPR